MMPGHKERVIFKVAIFVGFSLVVAGGGCEHFTAESRFPAKLDAELWRLHQSVQPQAISSEKREDTLAFLRCADPPSRWQAAADLAQWKDKASTMAIVAAMQDDEGTQKTCRMAQSLGAMGDSNAVPALLEAIHHPRNLDLRVCATHALAQIGDPRAVEALAAKATNLDLWEDDRSSAVMALGELASPEAVPALKKIATTDKDGRFRVIAVAALRQIEIMQTNDPVPVLAAELNLPAHWIQRSWIIQKLGESWDARSAAALNSFLLRTDAWSSDRIQAAALLLNHHALATNSVQNLVLSKVKENRWLAKYANDYDSSRPLPNFATTCLICQ